MGTTPTPPPAVQAGLAVFNLLRSWISPAAGTTMASPQNAQQVYLLVLQKLREAAEGPGQLPQAQFALYLRLVRSTAARQFLAFAASPSPPDPSLGASVDAAYLASVYTPPAGTVYTAAAQQAAGQLVSALLAMPAGTLNATAQWIRSVYAQLKGG